MQMLKSYLEERCISSTIDHSSEEKSIYEREIKEELCSCKTEGERDKNKIQGNLKTEY